MCLELVDSPLNLSMVRRGVLGLCQLAKAVVEGVACGQGVIDKFTETN